MVERQVITVGVNSPIVQNALAPKKALAFTDVPNSPD
jgi:hypothetical protein